MKVLVLGASGIIGQHLRLCVPEEIRPIWHRRTADRLHVGCDLTDDAAREAFLAEHRPDVIVNLAGESRPDVVEREPDAFEFINCDLPDHLAEWCVANASHLVHVSSQAALEPSVNAYGRQKAFADNLALNQGGEFVTIVRPTFVLGIRPLPNTGRENPLEQMLRGGHQKQVHDRWFSPSFAWDVARQIWRIAQERPKGKAFNLGVPVRTNRYEIARDVSAYTDTDIEPVSHDSWPGLAPRPVDTTYGPDALHEEGYQEGLRRAVSHDDQRYRRAAEIAIFLGWPIDRVLELLKNEQPLEAFHRLHAMVAADFKSADTSTDEKLLDWYRNTLSYIFELTAYHLDPGFNYAGMCAGIIERLKAEGCKRVLVLGDGIGDLTLALHRAGFEAVYHDLSNSRTSEFAKFRFWNQTGKEIPHNMTGGFNVMLCPEECDAILSFDFLEHVPNVDHWTAAIFAGLKPGGLFGVQNAFAAGSGPDGSIPCHLAVNDRYEKDWRPMVEGLGFEDAGGGNWWRKGSVELRRLRDAQVRETVTA